ncbi:thioesterase II family protein [uncultured Gilliamella sp.]|uniref:thioesterase II family protein n=1 Tax=uncultured Gilliamella sp. TaxID=1193505 RepID=UPI0025EA9EFE|nr:thioesterase domain-containing protein [uncultured Gilliamella sp.]
MNSALSANVTNNNASWCRIYQPRPLAKQRFICLPHAGGCASFFKRWPITLPSSIELVAIQYPGREERLAEPLINNMDELINGLIAALIQQRLLDKPYLLFGHSMGGYVVYELCLALRARNLPNPYQLVISASEAPSHKNSSTLHLETDEVILDEIEKLNGMPFSLATHPELAQMLLPIIRNDYQLIESWQPKINPHPFDIPISIFVALQDTELTEAQALAWEKQTTQHFHCEHFQGNHFYLIKEQAKVIQALVKIAKQQMRAHYQSMITP